MSQPDKKDHSTETGGRLGIVAAVIALVLVAGFLVVHLLKSRSEKDLAKATSETVSAFPTVDVVTVEKAPASFVLTLPGETSAWYESVIYARVDGYVAHWQADIGDHVHKGEVLATLDTPDLDAQLVAAKAKLTSAQALIVARQAEANFARTTNQRWKDSPKGVVSEQEREEKKAGNDSAIAHLHEARAQVGLDQADVERYLALTRFKKVTAPYDGTITERRIDIGNLVTAGSTANTTLLYRMVQDTPMRIFVDVPQSAAKDVKTGLMAQVSASNLPNRIFAGKVARTAEAINQQTRTLRVEVDISNLDHALMSGMYVNVGFLVATEGLVQVPAASLVFRSGGPQVAVVDKNNRITFQKVTIARDSGKSVEISTGLAAGDKIALNISSQIRSGETVEPHEFTEAASYAHTHK